MDDRAGAGFTRRRPGVGWLVALLAVPLLLAIIGLGAGNAADRAATERNATAREAPVGALTGLAPSDLLTAPPPAPGPAGPAAAPEPFGPFTLARTANGFALTGQLPTDAEKRSLAQSLRQAMPGAAVDDRLAVAPGGRGPEFAGLGAVFASALEVPGFVAAQADGTVTLRGRAPGDDARAAAEAAAGRAWPGARIVNDITGG